VTLTESEVQIVWEALCKGRAGDNFSAMAVIRARANAASAPAVIDSPVASENGAQEVGSEEVS
jgi:hypothetical protein